MPAPLPPAVQQIDSPHTADPGALLATLTAPARPVILRQLVADWPVCQAAAQSPEMVCAYLGGFASNHKTEIFLADPSVGGRYFYGKDLEGFNFTRAPATLASALDLVLARARAPSLGSAYLGSLPTPAYLPGFAQANPLPLIAAVPGQKVDPRIWIGTASHAACHYDTVDNLACAVVGPRRFTIYPPQAIKDLYVGPIDHTLAGQPVSLATEDVEHPDRYPDFARVRGDAMVIDLQPGDALYLPKLWWHQVDAQSHFNIMVNYWWDAHASGVDAPMLSMLLAMITIAERPQAERDAFRAYFEHYVFRGNGHPLAHLPEERRGILGKIDRSAYGRIRATIMRGLRGE